MQQRLGHHGALHALLLSAAAAVLVLVSASCEDAPEPPSSSSSPDKAADKTQDESGGASKLVNRFVPGTPLEIRVPDDWKFGDVKPPELSPSPPSDAGPAGAAKGRGLQLMSRTMLSARAPTSKLGERVTAWLLVQHDPWLPAGTTTTDYLEAQRGSNRDAVPDLKHVEAERSRRQGRPSYYVRDEWSAPYVGDERVTFSQETLLLIDVEKDQLHGYAITITLPQGDREALATTTRQMLDSVRFGKRRE